MMNRASVLFALVVCGLQAVQAADTAGVTNPANLVRDVPGLAATISVDSTFPGYRTGVLSDGKWIEKGKETTQDHSHADRLGNGGNTWVSADTDAEHWIRLDWPRPVTINEVHVWWSQSEWHPRAFRVEHLRQGVWTAIPGLESWLAATDRLSIIPLQATEVLSLRIVQPPGGGGRRSLMAAQEVLVFQRPAGPAARAGARELSAAEIRRLKPRKLERNLARLDCPGAASAVAWYGDGREAHVGGLADGDAKDIVPLKGRPEAFGVQWPIEHVVDGMAMVVAGEVPDAASLVTEVHDGRQWVPIRAGLRAERNPSEHRLVWAFEPVATRSLRARIVAGSPPPAVTEIEVYRYLPPAKNVWPDRLVRKGGLKDDMLAARDEPSFESLALCGLSMTPARALLGLKDATQEIGVAWDGTIIGLDTLRFSFGEDRDCLADCRDTVRRRLIDGWRPGTIVEGRIGPLSLRQTAFVGPVNGAPSRPALFIRIELENLSDKSIHTSVHADAASPKGPVRFQAGALLRSNQVVLAAQSASRAGQDGGLLRVDVDLRPGGKAHADFVCPQVAVGLGPALEPYRTASFGNALARFRAYWDQILAPAAKLYVPEARINFMHRAVLAQLFVNADGDIMPYGAAPSVYEGSLYGVEESYAMFALAMWGFGRDAQRYMDATYLTRDFLKKVDEYKTYADRHQQYRNGLQPHYAVSAYRFSRDTDWIRKHVPLLRECAEWTIAQRKRTMTPENGKRPLHWGLLPKWSYGGDISDVQCYPLYANYCCWRGLVDTAWLLSELGDKESARRYLDEAREYRASIGRAVDASFRGEHHPPFLPLRLYADRPDEQMDYYQLFAGCIFDLLPFERGSKHARWIADFLEADNRMFCLLPRFRRDAGPGGLDALYGKGYLLTKLDEDRVKEFLLGFYAFLVFNMDHETFASRETNVIYASDLHVRSRYEVPDMSDPVPCSAAVAIELLRHMLVTEERAGPGEFSGNLLLLPAVPRAWFGDGRTIRLADAPTHYGPVSFELRSAVRSGRIEVRLVPPRRSPYHAVKLRIRHPEGRPIRSVAVDGKPWPDVEPAGPWIVLPPQGASYHIVVNY
jgi:hypothetical protein